MHVNQRFRFKYSLGNGPRLSSERADAADDDEDEVAEIDQVALPGLDPADAKIDLDETNALVTTIMTEIRALARRHGDQMKADLGEVAEEDQRVVDELCEANRDRARREDEAFHGVSDRLMDEMALRFAVLDSLKHLFS